MPRTADNGYAREARFLRFANALAHVRLAPGLVFVLRGRVGPQFGHGLQDALEKVGHIAALLDLPLPPQFVVVVARPLSQQFKRFLAVGDWSLLSSSIA